MKFTFILPSPRTFASWEEFEHTVRAVARLGYDAIELQLGQASEVDQSRLKVVLQEEGIVLSSFQTGGSYAAEGICYTSQDDDKRRAAVARMRDFIDLAASFHALPVTGLLQGRRSDEPSGDVAYQKIYDCMREVSTYAKQKRVTVVIEPCNRMEVGFNNNVARVFETIDEVASEALQTMVDTYHANIEERTVVGAVEACLPHLWHLHLSETNRSDFGTGHLDFVGLFQALDRLRYQGFCAVGVYFTEEDLLLKAEHALEYVKTAYRLAQL